MEDKPVTPNGYLTTHICRVCQKEIGLNDADLVAHRHPEVTPEQEAQLPTFKEIHERLHGRSQSRETYPD